MDQQVQLARRGRSRRQAQRDRRSDIAFFTLWTRAAWSALRPLWPLRSDLALCAGDPLHALSTLRACRSSSSSLTFRTRRSRIPSATRDQKRQTDLTTETIFFILSPQGHARGIRDAKCSCGKEKPAGVNRPLIFVRINALS